MVGWHPVAYYPETTFHDGIPAPKPDRLLVLLCDFPLRNMPPWNDTYYVSFPLRIAEIPALNLTE